MPNKAKSFEERRGGIKCRDAMDRARHAGAEAIRSSARWHKVRRMAMARSPICLDPFGNHSHKTVAAREVHHIIPIEADESLAFTLANLIPLCNSCHRIADEMDKRDPNRQRAIMFIAKKNYFGEMG